MGDFNFGDLFFFAHDAGEDAGGDFSAEHFSAGDDFFANSAEDATDGKFADFGFDDFWGEELFHGRLSVVEQFVNDAEDFYFDAVFSGEAFDGGREIDVETVDGSACVGGEADVVFGDVADAGTDDGKVDFAVCVDHFEAVDNRGDGADDVGFNDDVEVGGVVFLADHF